MPVFTPFGFELNINLWPIFHTSLLLKGENLPEHGWHIASDRPLAWGLHRRKNFPIELGKLTVLPEHQTVESFNWIFLSTFRKKMPNTIEQTIVIGLQMLAAKLGSWNYGWMNGQSFGPKTGRVASFFFFQFCLLILLAGVRQLQFHSVQCHIFITQVLSLKGITDDN